MKILALIATLALAVPFVASGAAHDAGFRNVDLVATRMERAYNSNAPGSWRSQMRKSTNRPVSFGRVICSPAAGSSEVMCNGSFTYEGVRTTAKWMLFSQSAKRAMLNTSYWQRGQLVNAADLIISPRQLGLTRF